MGSEMCIRDSSGERGLPMINVTDCADVDVGLIPFECFFGHDFISGELYVYLELGSIFRVPNKFKRQYFLGLLNLFFCFYCFRFIR